MTKRLSEPDPNEIRDNGRRGDPLPGCDCVACFGRCLVDPDVKVREGFRRSVEAERE